MTAPEPQEGQQPIEVKINEQQVMAHQIKRLTSHNMEFYQQYINYAGLADQLTNELAAERQRVETLEQYIADSGLEVPEPGQASPKPVRKTQPARRPARGNGGRSR